MNQRLKALRKKIGLTQSEFGARLGVSGPAITKLEKGVNSITEQTFMSICREFSVNEEWLRTGNGDMFSLNEDAEIANLADIYGLDALDCSIIESYVKLGKFQRQTIRRFISAIIEQESTPSTVKPTDTIRVLTAAKSDNNRPMKYEEYTRAEMERLRNGSDYELD